MRIRTFFALALGTATMSASAINLTDTSLYSENFSSLANAGTGNAWNNDSTIPGWHLYQSTGAAITTYNAGTGSSGTGSFYSFGAVGSAERALGGLGSGGAYFGSPAAGAIAGWMAVALVNTSGGLFDGFSVKWDGEQWRNGGNTAAQTMVFEYGFGSAFGTVANWNTPGGSFDWPSPVNTSTAAAVDGNVDGRVPDIGGGITGLTWAAGETLWLRWVESNDAGNDHGLAIDNFSFRATTSTQTSVPDSLPFGATAATLLGMMVVSRRLEMRRCYAFGRCR